MPSNMQSPKNTASDAKPQLQLVPPVAMELMAHSLALGAKHGPWNWRTQPISLMKHLGAILRHTFAIIAGEWEDAEGNPHLGAIMATAAIIADAQQHNTVLDDKPKGKTP